jgi:hypothetical protein
VEASNSCAGTKDFKSSDLLVELAGRLADESRLRRRPGRLIGCSKSYFGCSKSYFGSIARYFILGADISVSCLDISVSCLHISVSGLHI